MTERETYYDHYPTPLADPNDTGEPPVSVAIPAVVRTRRLARRLLGRRRLAVLDTHFPWRLSGFRFHEFSEIHRQRPDTVFFSLYRMTEPFSAPVHRLAEFPRLAPRLGITDVYFVFLNFTVGLLGLSDHPDAHSVLGVRRDISLDQAFHDCGMRVHVTIYPGGGSCPIRQCPWCARSATGRTPSSQTWLRSPMRCHRRASHMQSPPRISTANDCGLGATTCGWSLRPMIVRARACRP
jgi:hypothetical protein